MNTFGNLNIVLVSPRPNAPKEMWSAKLQSLLSPEGWERHLAWLIDWFGEDPNLLYTADTVFATPQQAARLRAAMARDNHAPRFGLF